MNDVIDIAKHFCSIDLIEEVEPIGIGHINRTYRLFLKDGDDIILQLINGNVFSDIQGLSQNVETVLNHLSEVTDKYPQYVNTLSGERYVETDDGYWRAITAIPDSKVWLNLNGNSYRAQSCGTTLGEFHNLLRDIDTGVLKDILPEFHSAKRRFREFHEALQNADNKRQKTAYSQINFAKDFENKILDYSNDIFSGVLPQRVVHNDPKLSNILFDSDDEAICLIDYDTVMAGSVVTDFGDALRTVAASANEDEKSVDKISFDMNLYKQFVKGYINEVKSMLTDKEIDKLYYSPLYITFIMGLRFLTDYLNNDVYYSINYDDHNLVRAINQFTLVKDINGKLKEIKSVIISDL